MHIIQQVDPDVEGPQSADQFCEQELENVSKMKDPNMGRVSNSHSNSLPHHLPPLLTHFLHQFQHSYLKCISYPIHGYSMLAYYSS